MALSTTSLTEYENQMVDDGIFLYSTMSFQQEDYTNSCQKGFLPPLKVTTTYLDKQAHSSNVTVTSLLLPDQRMTDEGDSIFD